MESNVILYYKLQDLPYNYTIKTILTGITPGSIRAWQNPMAFLGSLGTTAEDWIVIM